MRPATLGILGLGPLSATLAARARAGGVPTILGWSPLPRDRVAAVRDGVLDDAPHRPGEIVAASDLVLLSGTAAENRHWLETLGPSLAPRRFMTDTGMVKRPIVSHAATRGLGDRFAGSRPAIGAGGAWSDGTVVYVTPVAGADGAAREIAHFWEATCGAQAVVLDADRHDGEVALTTQLGPLLAAVLAALLAERLPAGVTLDERTRTITTLLQSADPAQLDAAWENRDHLGAALRAAASATERVAAVLGGHDPVALASALESARQWRARCGP